MGFLAEPGEEKGDGIGEGEGEFSLNSTWKKKINLVNVQIR